MKQYQQTIFSNLYQKKQKDLEFVRLQEKKHFPTHDYFLEHNSQISDYSDSFSDENLIEEIEQQCNANLPYCDHNINLISSLFKQNILNKSIQDKKKNYNEMIKKKQLHRQKFLQKMDEILCIQSRYLPNQQNSIYQLNKQQINLQKKLKKKKSFNSNKKYKNQQNQQIKQQENLQIDFHLTSNRSQTYQHNQINNKKKKIRLIKQKFNQSNYKYQPEIKTLSSNSNNKEYSFNKSINQFLFLDQYRKDQKDIMDRLLRIIQQDHKKLLSLSSKKHLQEQQNESIKTSKIRQRSLGNSIPYPIQTSYQAHGSVQYSSKKPIIINNFIKSPSEFIDKNLIQKQITIKLLQNNRYFRKNTVDFSNQKFNVKSTQTNEKQLNQEVKNLKKSSEGSNNLLLCQTHQQNYAKFEKNRKSPHQPKQKHEKQPQSAQRSQETEKSQIKPQKFKQFQFEILYQKFKEQAQKAYSHKTSQTSSKPSHQISVSQTLNQRDSKLNIQNDSLAQSSRKHTDGPLSGNYHENLSENIHSLNSSSSAKFTEHVYNLKKPSVSMEISFGNENQSKQSISLADAFKKKFGNNKFANRKFDPDSKSSEVETLQQPSELKKLQNSSFHPKKKRFQKLQIKQSTKQFKRKRNDDQKQNFDLIQTPRSQLQHYSSTSRTYCTNLSKQPSKELLERLINGGKTTMTKKQMYQLSKKNYMKLPEIEEKRRLEEKRLKESERLRKIKQYQKEIRISKHPLTKTQKDPQSNQ